MPQQSRFRAEADRVKPGLRRRCRRGGRRPGVIDPDIDVVTGFDRTVSAHPTGVGDLNFTAAYQLTNVWSIRGGYQLLWLTGLALASEQFPQVSHHFVPDLDVVDDGSLFLHGALVSLEAAW